MDSEPTAEQQPPGDAVAEIAACLKTQFGLPELHSEVLALAATCAAVGTSRGVLNPSGGIVPPTLQLLCIGKAQATFQSAMRAAFNPINEVQNARYAKTVMSGGEQTRDQIHRIKTEIGKNRAEITKVDDELNPASMHGGRMFSDADTYLKFNEAVNPTLLKQKQALEERIAELQKSLHQLHVVQNPCMLSHSMLPSQINDMRRDSVDGVLFNFDERGTSQRELLSFNSKRRREICHATVAALDQVTVRPDNPRHGPLGHSGAAVLTDYLAAKLLRNKVVCASGLLEHLLFLRLDEAPDLSTPAELLTEESIAGRLAEKLMVGRAENKSAVLKLSAAARDVFWTLQREIEKKAVIEPEESQPRLILVPLLALKFALLYHVGAGCLDNAEIGAEVFTMARDLVWKLWEHQKSALQIPGDEALTDRCFDLEVLKLVAKVKMMGGATKREIARSCHNQDYRRLEPLLLKAVADDWIEERNGRYVAVTRVSAAA